MDPSAVDPMNAWVDVIGQAFPPMIGAVIGGGIAAMIAWRVFVSERRASTKDRETERQAASVDRAEQRDLDALDRQAEREHAREMRAEELASVRNDRYDERVHAATEPLLEALSGMLLVKANAQDTPGKLISLHSRVTILHGLLRGDDKPIAAWLGNEIIHGTSLIQASIAASKSSSEAEDDTDMESRKWVALLTANVTLWLRDRPAVPQKILDRVAALEAGADAAR
ncbi:hypothetical protein ASF68_06895 [Plantibacter sp. Leaf314]|nr:hypothetical protein ASF68_06895 [Plantibacter sp. Leaf314]